MKRIEREWKKIEAAMGRNKPLTSGQKEAMRLMFYAGAAGAANIMMEAEKAPNGVQIIEEFGRELAEADMAPTPGAGADNAR